MTEPSRFASVGAILRPTGGSQVRGADHLALRQLSIGHVLASLHLVGVVSDTHGLIRPEAIDALRGSELIVHCGVI